MARTLSAIRQVVQQMLLDEFKEGIDLKWEPDQLDTYIQLCVTEISDVCPYEVKETLQTTANSKELDISSIENFIRLDPEHEIEYTVGNDPPDYHNASIFGNTLRMAIDAIPSANQDVYLYCHKYHQLTDELSTLTTQMENVIILGACALAAISKAQSHINTIPIGGGRTTSDMQGWGISKMGLYQLALRNLARSKRYIEYPKS